MGLRIATNISSLSAQRTLSANYSSQARSMERMSSGSRINRAADDAAGLAISETMKGSIRSLKQASRNANDGEISNILVRLRELSIQAANDTLGSTERAFIDKEVQQLKSEIDRISQSTEFNGKKLLNGSEDALEFQIGKNNNPEQDRIVFDSKGLISTAEHLGVGQISTATKEAAQNNLESIDRALNKLNENRATLGALQNRLQSTINNLEIYRENTEAANSRIRDTDMAEESSVLMKNNILTQGNISVLAQANQIPSQALKLIG
jgi:flagellin